MDGRSPKMPAPGLGPLPLASIKSVLPSGSQEGSQAFGPVRAQMHVEGSTPQTGTTAAASPCAIRPRAMASKGASSCGMPEREGQFGFQALA